jgi:hypothetical protein
MKYDINKMLEEIKTLPQKKDIHFITLQSWTKDKTLWDPFVVPTKNLNSKPDIDYNIKMFDIPYINSIIDEYNLYKARITTLTPRECYTWHRDLFPRVHVPIVSDPFKCFMIIQSKFDPNDKGEIHRMPIGEAYYVDTTKHHTAINGGTENRIHLMGTVREPC